MKLTSWITAALFALGLAATASLSLGVGSGAADAVTPRLEGPAAVAIDRELEVLRGAFSEVESSLKHESEGVARRVHGAVTEGLKAAIELWEADPPGRPALARKISSDLEASRLVHGLDILAIVTSGDEVIAAAGAAGLDASLPGAAEKSALARSALVLATGDVFRDGRPTNGCEWLPASYSSRRLGAPRPLGDRTLCAAAAAPVWLRSEAPHSVLIGGVEIESLEPTLRRSFPARPDRFQWHLVCHDAAGKPIVLAGDRRGAMIRTAFYEQLLSDGVSEEPAFVEDVSVPHPGRWAVLKARDGSVLAGWGLSLPPGFVAAHLGNATPAAGVLALVARVDRSWLPAITGGTAVLGVAFVVLLWLRLRSGRAAAGLVPKLTESAAAVGMAAPPVAPRGGADLLSQFEVNWKTFASYTQDLLHQKLKELEGAPQKGVNEVREQVAQLAAALAEVKSDLAVARSEVKDTTHGVVEKVAHLVEQGSQEKSARATEEEGLLKKIEADLDRASSRFNNLDVTVTRLAEIFGDSKNKEIEDRVATEVDRLQAQWNERLEAFAAEIEEAKKQGQALVEDLARARELEGSLRIEIEAGGARESALKAEQDELRAQLELAQKDRDAAWRREREVIEEIHTIKGREDAALGKSNELEAEIQRLQGAIGEGKAREEMLRQELEAAHANEEKLREAIKEIYREEGRAQRDLQQKERDLASERDAFNARILELETKVQTLTLQAEEDGEAEGKLAALVEARQQETEALQRIVRALNEEKERLEADLQRDAQELSTLRAERATFDGARLRALEEDNARLRSESAHLSRELSRERHDAANLAQSLEIHKIELADLTAQVASTDGEMDALRNESDRKTVELERVKAALEAREEELGPAKEALEKALQASLSEVKRLREESETRGGESRASRELAEKALLAARSDGERTERALRDMEKRQRVTEEERSRLKVQLADAEARAQGRAGELEARAAESERRAAEATRRLAEAEATEKSLRARLEAAATETRVGQETNQRLQALEREKGELAASLTTLSRELDRSRQEAEGIRRFQGTLVDGCLPAAIAGVDVSLKTFAWNLRAEKLWGIPAEHALGKLLTELQGPGFGREVVELAQKTVREGKTGHLPQVTVPGDKGGLRHVALSCDPILGPEGEPLGAIVLAEEITEKVEREIEAKLQSLFTQSLSRSLPAALVVIDGQGRVISWSRTAESVLGVTEKAALGVSFFQLKTPLAKEAFRRQFEAARQDRAVHRVRVRFDHKGAPAAFTVTQAPFVGDDDQVRGTILLVQEAGDPAEASRASGARGG